MNQNYNKILNQVGKKISAWFWNKKTVYFKSNKSVGVGQRKRGVCIIRRTVVKKGEGRKEDENSRHGESKWLI